MVSFIDENDNAAVIIDNTSKATPPVQNSETQQAHPRLWCGASDSTPQNNDTKVYHYAHLEEKEKTPMCQIAELCRHQKIKHEYKLLDESGPAHKKMFTVQLIITVEETYIGVGGSIKKAQQAAAAIALKETKLEFPSQKKTNRRKSAMTSTTLLLRHVCQRLNFPEPIYKRELTPMLPPLQLNPYFRQGDTLQPHPYFAPIPPPFRPPSNEIPVNTNHDAPPRNFSRHNEPVPLIHPNFFKKPNSSTTVVLYIGAEHPKFVATSFNFPRAKERCAAQALSHLSPVLKQLDQKLKEQCANAIALAEKDQSSHSTPDIENENLNETAEAGSISPESNKKIDLLPNESSDSDDDCLKKENCIAPKCCSSDEECHDLMMLAKSKEMQRAKSIVSKLHEVALKMRLDIAFELVSESGPAHDREYVVRCIVCGPIALSADGAGKNKKIAKQVACEKVLQMVDPKTTETPIVLAQNIYRTVRKSQQSKEKRKTITKDKKMDPEYGHQINPVSRLMQISQARSATDPVFEFTREQGQGRYKEFIVEVKWNDMMAEGMGPNKRLAKRAAAENLLLQIGYVKPLPPPGKSLLKKRSVDGDTGDCMSSIGMFNINDLQSAENSDSPVFQDKNQRPLPWQTLTVDVPSKCGGGNSEETSPSTTDDSSSAEHRRKVTFSSEVAACPPPDDSTYPAPEITHLKNDDMTVVARLTKRDRKHKRILSDSQITELIDKSNEFIMNFDKDTRHANILVDAPQSASGVQSPPKYQLMNAHRRLETLSEKFKFTVQFCRFSSSKTDVLSLVTMGLEIPQIKVETGMGSNEAEADDKAAYSAIKSFAALSLKKQ